MKHLDLILLSLCLSQTQSLSTYTDSLPRQRHYRAIKSSSTTRKRVKPSPIRGLSWQTNLFKGRRNGYDNSEEPPLTADEDENEVAAGDTDKDVVYARNDFDTRRRMNREPKGGKRMRNSSDEEDERYYNYDYTTSTTTFIGAVATSEDAMPGAETSPYFSTKEPYYSRPTTKRPSISPTRFPTIPTTTRPQRPMTTMSPTRPPLQTTSSVQTDQPTWTTSTTDPPSAEYIQQTQQPSYSSTTTTTSCQVDSNGDFGTQLGDETQVDYLYQMEIYAGLSIQEASQQIEELLVNLLLPELFPQQCASIRRRRLKKNTDNHITSMKEFSEYVGLSSAPQDSLAVGFECVGRFVDPCFVIRGWVTAYSEGKSAATVKEEISGEIYTILESGEIERSIVDVDKVTSLRDPNLLLELDAALPPTTTRAPVVRSPSISSSSRTTTATPSTLYPTRGAPIRSSTSPPPPTAAPNNTPNYSSPKSEPWEYPAANPPSFSTQQTTDAPTTTNYYYDNPPAANADGTSSSFVSPSSIDKKPTSTIEVTDEKPFILQFPWWGWVAILVGILFLFGVKAAIDKFLSKKDANT